MNQMSEMNQSNRMKRFNCPCCGYPTLEERGGWEICRLCKWEDDGQDDPHADEVWGGPNADYSLTEARHNFRKYYIMYRDQRNILQQSEQEIATKKALMIEYDKLQTTANGSAKPIWKEITALENILGNIVSECIERYTRNIEKN